MWADETYAVCGGRGYEGAPVLWKALSDQWRLSPEEITYVDRHQGWRCMSCRANLRSIALANAILIALGKQGSLKEMAPALSETSILDINKTGDLTPTLSLSPGCQFAAYPQVDMHDMPYADESFDLVVHSDTFERVVHPVRALAECRRILKPGGACRFTVPVIVGRMTTSRAGLPPSYHGDASTGRDDFLVHTEFGADVWTTIVRAGFSHVGLAAVDFPSATAWIGYR
jgi:SAM-dependent methyltransferase